jgi:ubiquinone/menaquinone biosynthesis C-methylase UbiE
MTDSRPIDRLATEPGEVARAYDRWAAQYDEDRNTTRDLDAAVARRAPLRIAGRDVLELGCGTGKNTVWLAREARQVHALDFSEGMLAEARRRIDAPNVRFIQHDVRLAWPLPAASVDVVVGNLVLEHVRDLAPIHAEAARVLRPGGQLFLCELHPFRQLRGGQAHFVDEASGETVHVPAFTHSTSEYVNGGISAGLVLRELGEWLEPEAPAEMPPRLLSLLFERS